MLKVLLITSQAAVLRGINVTIYQTSDDFQHDFFPICCFNMKDWIGLMSCHYRHEQNTNGNGAITSLPAWLEL